MTGACGLCGLSGAYSTVRIQGAPIVCCTCCARLANEHDPTVWIRPLSSADLELVLAWRSNPLVYRHFRGQDGPLNWEDHVSWFQSRPIKRHDFVIKYGDRRVGLVSLDADDHVSIYLGDVSVRGEGVASAALRWLCSRFGDARPLRAEIHESNEDSIALFERCGFEAVGREGGWLEYKFLSAE